MERAHRHRWTHSDELLALILERIDALFNLTQFVNMKEQARPARLPDPYRYPRPHPRRKPKPSTAEQVRSFFTRFMK